jgi:tetratricopeptide (TPR) repeat protein
MMGRNFLRRGSRMVIQLPEPFRTAIRRGAPASVCDLEATEGADLFARGMARMQVGRDAEARSDFEAAREELGNCCGIELGFLDLRAGVQPSRVADAAQQIVENSGDDDLQRARALHLLGLAEIKRRGTAAALDALLQAADVFRRLDRRDLLAQVQDTLGQEAAAEGRVDHAVSWFALSLIGKTLAGDRYGMAITLGNLGRLHLRTGRMDEALDCLQLDLEMAREIGDRRAEARLLNDLGRVRLAQEGYDEARENFEASLQIAEAGPYRDLVFFNNKDLALLHLRRGEKNETEHALSQAGLLAGDAVPEYRKALVDAIRGQLELASGEGCGLERLQAAADTFSRLELPDDEIPERLRIAEALMAEGRPRAAEQQVTRAMEVARRDGYARYLPAIREAMGRLSLVESAVEEKGRQIHSGGSAGSVPEGYVLFESLGRGGFGEVFRAFDAERARIVAFKRLHLERLYDVPLRTRLQSTARLELEAASRIRHPGVVRVHAVGTDADGGTYIVQDFIEGPSLRNFMHDEPDAAIGERLKLIGLIANALQALHGERVVHRDLKPENILLREGELTPVLVDFGVARLPDAEDVVGEEAIVGTLGYMAPEQLLGKAVDGASDVYSLGVLLLEWLTGTPPIRPKKLWLSEAISHVLHRRAHVFEKVVGDLPPDVARLAGRMLAVDPRERPSAKCVADTCSRVSQSLLTEAETFIAEKLPPASGADEDEDAIETEWID